MCRKGKPVKKTRVAETLWPDAPLEIAMSSMYKVCRYIRELTQDGIIIPIAESRGEVWFDMTGVVCDLTEFEKFYADKNNIESCASAVELYGAQLFFDECYEWVSPWEAYSLSKGPWFSKSLWPLLSG